jgi:hypothetical protein
MDSSSRYVEYEDGYGEGLGDDTTQFIECSRSDLNGGGGSDEKGGTTETKIVELRADLITAIEAKDSAGLENAVDAYWESVGLEDEHYHAAVRALEAMAEEDEGGAAREEEGEEEGEEEEEEEEYATPLAPAEDDEDDEAEEEEMKKVVVKEVVVNEAAMAKEAERAAVIEPTETKVEAAADEEVDEDEDEDEGEDEDEDEDEVEPEEAEERRGRLYEGMLDEMKVKMNIVDDGTPLRHRMGLAHGSASGGSNGPKKDRFGSQWKGADEGDDEVTAEVKAELRAEVETAIEAKDRAGLEKAVGKYWESVGLEDENYHAAVRALEAMAEEDEGGPVLGATEGRVDVDTSEAETTAAVKETVAMLSAIDQEEERQWKQEAAVASGGRQLQDEEGEAETPARISRWGAVQQQQQQQEAQDGEDDDNGEQEQEEEEGEAQQQQQQQQGEQEEESALYYTAASIAEQPQEQDEEEEEEEEEPQPHQPTAIAISPAVPLTVPVQLPLKGPLPSMTVRETRTSRLRNAANSGGAAAPVAGAFASGRGGSPLSPEEVTVGAAVAAGREAGTKALPRGLNLERSGQRQEQGEGEFFEQGLPRKLSPVQATKAARLAKKVRASYALSLVHACYLSLAISRLLSLVHACYLSCMLAISRLLSLACYLSCMLAISRLLSLVHACYLSLAISRLLSLVHATWCLHAIRTSCCVYSPSLPQLISTCIRALVRQAMEGKRNELREGLAKERRMKEAAAKKVEVMLHQMEVEKEQKREEKMDRMRLARAVQLGKEMREQERHAFVEEAQRSGEQLSVEQLAVCLGPPF